MFIDIFLIILLVWGAFSGWRNGLVREGLNLLGYIVGIIAAVGFYAIFSDSLSVTGSDTNMVLSVIAFLILCIIVPAALGFLGTMLTRLLDFSPVGMVNHVVGGVFGIVKFVLLVSFCFNYMENLNIINRDRLPDSSLYVPVRDLLTVLSDRGEEAGVEVVRPGDLRSDTTYIDMRPASTLDKSTPAE